MSVSNVIPFPLAPPPPAAARVMLQPSLHARGARPFMYSGKIDEWHAPGVTTRDGNTFAAVDAAWLCERVLGPARRSPNMWPGVPGARDRALWFGKQLGLATFQQDGAAFLAERDYGLLVDEPGIGKTVQTITAAETRLSMASIPTPKTPAVLVICPSLAKRHWQAEVRKWVGHESAVLETLTPDPEQLCERYVIANYDILYGGQKADAAGVIHNVAHLPGWGQTLMGRFPIVIFDEAHVLRGRTSRRAKTAKMVCNKVPVVWALTGTPMPNYVRDLFMLLDIVSDGLMGYSYWKWAIAYAGAVQSTYGMVDKGSSRLDELQARLGFYMLGRTAASVQLQLPEKRREVVRVDVEVTAPTRREGQEALNKSGAVMSALRKTAFAKRSAVVGAAVEAMQAKQKVVVFVYMRDQADAIAKEVKRQVDGTIFCVHGDLSPDGRYAQAQAFREAAAPACFVATIDSMGVALSLVGANLVVFGDVVPEPWKLLQAEKRCHRFDSVTRLLVRYFIATGTVDEGIAEAVIAKIPIIEQTLGQQSDADDLTKMLGGKTNEEIVDVLFAKLLSWGGRDA
jgi:SNF2 family DNA or RNA helicase